MKALGHRALFGKGVSLPKVAEGLAPYAVEEVVLVLTSLAALLAHPESEERETQRALAHAFFLESAGKVETKIKAGQVLFHRRQVLACLRLAQRACRGDRGSQPVGAAFFEGIARALAALTDHLPEPKAPRAPASATPRDEFLLHLNHLLEGDSLPARDIRSDLLRAHHLLFELGPRVFRQAGQANLIGDFHNREGTRAAHWFAMHTHLLARALDYTLATMHSHRPAVRIAADFRGSALQTRQAARLFGRMVIGLHPREESPFEEWLKAKGFAELSLFHRHPVIDVIEDTFVAADPHLLAREVAVRLGSRFVGSSADPRRAATTWREIVRLHAQSLLPSLTAPLKKAARAVGKHHVDWWHVKGSDALLVTVITPTARRHFPEGNGHDRANGGVAGALLHALRQAEHFAAAWAEKKIQPDGKAWGRVKRLFPVAIAEEELPQDATFHRLLVKWAKAEDVASEKRIQPLTIIPLPALEALAGSEKPPVLTALVAKRAGTPLKNKPFSDFLAKQGLPTAPEVEEKEFEKLVKKMRKELGVAQG